jgi:hypothetical protein
MKDLSVVNVTILGLGTDAQKVVVNVGDSLAVCLAQAVLETEGMDLRVNGKAATKETIITKDAVVTAMPAVEGGF